MDAAILYPNCDFGIWFRSVNENNTTAEPIEGKTTGKSNVEFVRECTLALGVIPDWINGCLYQNGPGVLDATGQRVHHLFDAFSLIQKYADGRSSAQLTVHFPTLDSPSITAMSPTKIASFSPRRIRKPFEPADRAIPSTARRNTETVHTPLTTSTYPSPASAGLSPGKCSAMNIAETCTARLACSTSSITRTTCAPTTP